MIDRPGVYALSHEAYHADPCPLPSLSSSIARLLLERSPRHAWTRHPRLNPACEPEHDAKFDLGAAAHAMILRDARAFAIVEAEDWRTKAAQGDRDKAREQGRIPLLVAQYERVRAMARAAREQLDGHEDSAGAFRDGLPEQTLVWREGEAWCRARLDWLPARPGRDSVFYDYKSTEASANPERYGRTLFESGLDVQAAFYARAIRAVLEVEAPQFRLVVQECEEPYALAVIGLPPAAVALADKKVDAALALWRDCLATGVWPGYPTRTCYVEAPSWHEARWLERELRDAEPGAVAAELKRIAAWQAPNRERRDA